MAKWLERGAHNRGIVGQISDWGDMCVFMSETSKPHMALVEGKSEILLTLPPQLPLSFSSCIYQLTSDGEASLLDVKAVLK